jgi:hypothetical protein
MGVITVRGVNFESYSSYLRTTSSIYIVYRGGCMMHSSHFCARICIQRTLVDFIGVGIAKYANNRLQRSFTPSNPRLIYDVSRGCAKTSVSPYINHGYLDCLLLQTFNRHILIFPLRFNLPTLAGGSNMRWYICFTLRRQSLIPCRCMVYSMTRLILALQIDFFLLLTSLHVNCLVTRRSNFGITFVHLAATGVAAE